MTTTTFGPEMTLGEARRQLFERSGFAPDGGYQDRWVKLRLWRVPLWFPNTDARRRCVPLHDLHHVLTEYPTTWRGETEIGAWEVATGIRQHYVGWLLDLLGFAMGLVINPRGVFRAFVRGRRSRNLYDEEWHEGMLARRVGEERRRLKLDAPDAPPTPADVRSFLLWSAVSVATYCAAAAVMLLPLLVFAAAALAWAGALP